MMKVEAVIPPHRLEAVRAALDSRGVSGLTVSEVLGFGYEPDRQASYRGSNYRVESAHRLRVEIVTSDAEAGPLADAIARAARTRDDVGGLVTILRIAEAVRVRTGERGSRALAGIGTEAELPGHVAPPSRPRASARPAAKGVASLSSAVLGSSLLLSAERWLALWRRR